ncbi:hypothetical protein GY45DRAFT_1109350 [Cubamyces sp. BRFM 1775]|nr:hypothetical protein GY45DRAFT_1109350 [Cubamyces sp. BRFM 1775]
MALGGLRFWQPLPVVRAQGGYLPSLRSTLRASVSFGVGSSQDAGHTRQVPAPTRSNPQLEGPPAPHGTPAVERTADHGRRWSPAPIVLATRSSPGCTLRTRPRSTAAQAAPSGCPQAPDGQGKRKQGRPLRWHSRYPRDHTRRETRRAQAERRSRSGCSRARRRARRSSPRCLRCEDQSRC